MLSEVCLRSAGAARDFDGNFRVFADSTKVDNLGHLLVLWACRLDVQCGLWGSEDRVLTTDGWASVLCSDAVSVGLTCHHNNHTCQDRLETDLQQENKCRQVLRCLCPHRHDHRGKGMF